MGRRRTTANRRTGARCDGPNCDRLVETQRVLRARRRGAPIYCGVECRDAADRAQAGRKVRSEGAPVPLPMKLPTPVERPRGRGGRRLPPEWPH